MKNLLNGISVANMQRTNNHSFSIPPKTYSPHQQGASVTGIVFGLFALGILIKLAIAIIPAQIGDYQFTKLVAQELHRANASEESATDFMKQLNKQLSINASYDTSPEDMITLTSNQSGHLAVHKDYDVINNFIGNVDILNRFEGDIAPEGAEE